MKLIKTLMITAFSLTTFAVVSSIPTPIAAAAFKGMFKNFWERLFTVLLSMLELYLETAIKRGYWKVAVPATPIVNAFNNQADRDLAGGNGLVFDGHTLTVPEDIVLYVKDDMGAALQRGDYPIDEQGKFHFNLIRVIKPVPSPTFPIPETAGY